MMLRRLSLALLLALAPGLAAAESPVAFIAPTPSAGDNSNRIATTAFVQAASGGSLVLATGKIFVGSAGGIATAQTVTGDCTLTNLGAITCTKTNGTIFATIATSGSASDLSAGTVASTRGGAGAINGALKGNGAGVVSQAACADLSNAAASCATDATNASNIATGTLPAGRLPAPTASTLGGIQSLTCAANQWLNTISTSGVPACAQPAFSNLSGSLSSAQQTASVDTLTGCTTQGSVLYRNASTWVCLGPGSNGQLFSSGGPVANPSWITASGTGTVTSVVCDGVTITGSGTCPPRFGFANCTITASVATNNLTVALKDNAGADPSAGSPCNVWFRSATAAPAAGSAIWVQRTVTAATSFTANAGSTFGITNTAATCLAASACPFRLWVTLIDTGTTAALGIVALTNASGVLPLDESAVVTTTACSACATATTIGTMYSTAAQTSRPFAILGYMDWGTGLGTITTWTSGPTLVQTMGPGIRKPGEVIQTRYVSTATTVTNATTTFVSSNLTANITPQSAVNPVVVNYVGTCRSAAAASDCITQAFKGATAVGQIYASFAGVGADALTGGIVLDTPNATASTTYTIKFRDQDNATTISFPIVGGASMTIQEIMGALPEIIPDNDNDPRLLNAVG